MIRLIAIAVKEELRHTSIFAWGEERACNLVLERSTADSGCLAVSTEIRGVQPPHVDLNTIWQLVQRLGSLMRT
jgi:hypothetical protein